MGKKGIRRIAILYHAKGIGPGGGDPKDPPRRAAPPGPPLLGAKDLVKGPHGSPG